MTFQSICPEITLPDPAADYKTAKKAGRIRMSDHAFYTPAFPGARYLPFDAIRRVWAQDSTFAAKGCCGAQMPIVVLRVRYEGGFFQNFTFDKREETDAILARMAALRPDIPQGPADSPAE